MIQTTKSAGIAQNPLLCDVLIDDSKTFREYHNQLLSKYEIEFENNCDYWAVVTGNIYSKGEKFVCHIKGIKYDEDGDWVGDLDGYLKLLEKTLAEEFGF
jgi:hypothetical protein